MQTTYLSISKIPTKNSFIIFQFTADLINFSLLFSFLRPFINVNLVNRIQTLLLIFYFFIHLNYHETCINNDEVCDFVICSNGLNANHYLHITCRVCALEHSQTIISAIIPLPLLRLLSNI
jgi:hypothetical protein